MYNNPKWLFQRDDTQPVSARPLEPIGSRRQFTSTTGPAFSPDKSSTIPVSSSGASMTSLVATSGTALATMPVVKTLAPLPPSSTAEMHSSLVPVKSRAAVFADAGPTRKRPGQPSLERQQLISGALDECPIEVWKASSLCTAPTSSTAFNQVVEGNQIQPDLRAKRDFGTMLSTASNSSSLNTPPSP
ncbi:unnamed protein product [Protopolystoma xenopodis]|uniref:Uncharacterized protein n=1 Tax=Protopolystoma xenopodis TaxID=117903 RepID=A0A448XIB3_9PLAT|nr:unnamed protein product [Protopolystoma xenopodis]